MPPKKNPVKPKGKMTAYAFFVNACRLEHHNQFPGQKIKLSEFSTVCAKRWKEMTMDQKRPFAEMADRDKMRYENELKLLFPGENTPKRRRKKKDPNAPKKNLSPFFIFSKLKRPEIMKDHPSKGVGEISKVLSAEWSNMSEEDKSMYVRMSEEDKVRYQKQLEQYKETGTVTAAIMGAPVVGGEDDDEDDEEEEDEFAYPGGTHGASVSGAVAMTSGQQQAFQSQQNMVTSSVQQGSSQNNQQFSNGQNQMYQTGMMIQQQNMMGGQPQFNNGSNSGQMQMMQQTSQPQQMQGQMHPNFGSPSNQQQQFMNASQQQQQNRMMQPQQHQTVVSTTGNSLQQNNSQQFMMSMSNNGPSRTPPSQQQFSSQQPQSQQIIMQQNNQMHQGSVDMQQQQMHAKQLMQQAAAYQQINNPNTVSVQPQQISSTQSQIIDEIKPSIQDIQQQQGDDVSSLQHQGLANNESVQANSSSDDQHFGEINMQNQSELNGAQSGNNTPPTTMKSMTPQQNLPVSSAMEIKQESVAVQDGSGSLMASM
ncbi:TOX high mobility group box family member 4-like isoform X2 [Symsagittifera roscoffensis]|uniref:TOX high mobility group box family member 4-like isoform X2 n=1 Tax=Symsagittifera roscoffensis TaxID=84072 RepID=UPI00307C7459